MVVVELGKVLGIVVGLVLGGSWNCGRFGSW